MIVVSSKKRLVKQRTCIRTFLPHLTEKANQTVTCDMTVKLGLYALNALFFHTSCGQNVVDKSNGNILSVKWLGRELGCWGNCTIWTKVSRRKLCEDVSYLCQDNVNKFIVLLTDERRIIRMFVREMQAEIVALCAEMGKEPQKNMLKTNPPPPKEDVENYWATVKQKHISWKESNRRVWTPLFYFIVFSTKSVWNSVTGALHRTNDPKTQGLRPSHPYVEAQMPPPPSQHSSTQYITLKRPIRNDTTSFCNCSMLQETNISQPWLIDDEKLSEDRNWAICANTGAVMGVLA